MQKSNDRTTELKQKIANVRKQCNEYDSLLRHFSINVLDLPPNMQKDLDEHAHFKRKLGLFDMDLVFLNEFDSINSERNIEKNMAISRIKYNIEEIDKELIETNCGLAEYKSFVENVRKQFQHVKDIDRVLVQANRNRENFEEKKMKLKRNIKIDLDRILLKLEQLAE